MAAAVILAVPFAGLAGLPVMAFAAAAIGNGADPGLVAAALPAAGRTLGHGLKTVAELFQEGAEGVLVLRRQGGEQGRTVTLDLRGLAAGVGDGYHGAAAVGLVRTADDESTLLHAAQHLAEGAGADAGSLQQLGLGDVLAFGQQPQYAALTAVARVNHPRQTAAVAQKAGKTVSVKGHGVTGRMGHRTLAVMELFISASSFKVIVKLFQIYIILSSRNTKLVRNLTIDSIHRLSIIVKGPN
jgi:hypothetical protein